jgi:ketosteroid isomerase-like protein
VEIVLELDDLDEVSALYEHGRSRVSSIEPLRPQSWGLHDFRLFDPDGYYVRHPLHPLGERPLLSRAAVREHFAAGGPPADVERYDVIDDHVFGTPDPEVVIFEFRYAGVVNGRAFTLPCIFVVRVRDGEIVESRDYADHAGGARAFAP